jgi:hypothetical protein
MGIMPFSLKRAFHCAVISLVIWIMGTQAHAQELAQRLILKDGSYQTVTKWEVQGDRVRYLSAERGEWEEIPFSLVDWDATDKYKKNRAAGAPAPEAVELDKELAAEQAAELAKLPEVAPGLRLPEDGLVLMLDNFQAQPQLISLEQNGGEVDRDTRANILRAVINPVASAKQTIELDGPHASIQSHIGTPSVYINIKGSTDPSSRPEQPQQPEKPQQPMQDWDRFHIVRAQIKGKSRIFGNIKINPLGKSSQQENLVATTAQKIDPDWVRLTPNRPLDPGEYAVVEMMGLSGINLYVWDFGINPSAPANHLVITPEPSASPKTADKSTSPRP